MVPLARLSLGLGLAAVLALHAPAQQPDARLHWWREARFGLFLHWGLYAIPAGEWQGRTDHGEWIRDTARIPVTEYAKLQAQWNPVRFDADAWARMAKAAGMRYVVITTKHHDGFALFDSRHTEWDVMGTPWRRDVMHELAEACRRHGLRIGWYHSILDWHHPDYLPRRPWEAGARGAEGAEFARYVEFLHAQVAELLTRYGPIGVMWFDGEWESTWTHAHGKALYELCRRLQPEVIVNNRVDKGRAGMAGMTTSAEFLGDFGTPEQEVPATGFPGVDWESCITMNRHWGWNRADTAWKSDQELIRMLVDIASKGGNLLLNIGPTAAGEFPPESVARLKAIGAWMAVHGEAIHGTTASPFESLPFGRCTVRTRRGASTLYLHVFEWPADGVLVVPGLGNELRGARLLADPERRVEAVRAGADVRVRVPGSSPDPRCAVVALELEGAPLVYRAPVVAAAHDEFVDELRVELRPGTPGLDVRYTLDGGEPGPGSPRATGPLVLRDTTTVRTRTFEGVTARSTVVARTFTRVRPWPAAEVPDTEPGLHLRVHKGAFARIPDLTPLAALPAVPVAAPEVPATFREEDVLHLYEGYLAIERDGLHEFALASDDGSRLWIDDRLVVDHDGTHGPEERRGFAPLAQGLHRVRVAWFNRSGGALLRVRHGLAGVALVPVPPESWRRARSHGSQAPTRKGC